eukprot:TRINITY_DN15774_c0_g1_i1.p1 TRINITY_DN15774_c0_g1~~TRINITY_DN15774_c0_g1_i1.p1  ORF type:complete len:281 (-),score=32.67 TRINITY_DN15774_c0_g1_i1:938-1780(-)
MFRIVAASCRVALRRHSAFPIRQTLASPLGLSLLVTRGITATPSPNDDEHSRQFDTLIRASIKLIKQAGQSRNISQCKSAHKALPADVQSFTMDNALLDMYANCGAIPEAKALFDEIARYHEPSAVTYTSMFKAYRLGNQPDGCVALYEHMKARGTIKVDDYMLVELLRVVPMLRRPNTLAMELYALATRENLLNGHVAATLMSVLGRLGNVSETRAVFDRLRVEGRASENVWTSLLAAYRKSGLTKEARWLEMEMQKALPRKPSAAAMPSASGHSNDGN